jgi:AcrR family transcriptional regulator
MEYVIDVDRRERKRQAVRQSLLQVAEGLFRERGVVRTTVDDIAESADVARQTVFNHFPYKEAFALELAAKGVTEVGNRAHALLEAGVPALEVLQRTAQWALEEAIAQGELAVVVARELLHSDPERARRAAQQVPLCDIFESILIQAREEGAIRSDLPVEGIAQPLSAIFRCLLLRVKKADAEFLRQELDISFEIVLNGITDRSR